MQFLLIAKHFQEEVQPFTNLTISRKKKKVGSSSNEIAPYSLKTRESVVVETVHGTSEITPPGFLHVLISKNEGGVDIMQTVKILINQKRRGVKNPLLIRDSSESFEQICICYPMVHTCAEVDTEFRPRQNLSAFLHPYAVADDEIILAPKIAEVVKAVNNIHRIPQAIEDADDIVTLPEILMSKKADVTSRKDERIDHVHKQCSGSTADQRSTRDILKPLKTKELSLELSRPSAETAHNPCNKPRHLSLLIDAHSMVRRSWPNGNAILDRMTDASRTHIRVTHSVDSES
jgi:hypothetical protein